MTFVSGHGKDSERPIKKRKLFHSAEMAGFIDKEEGDHSCLQVENSTKTGIEEQSTQEEAAHASEEIRTSSREELIECIKRGQKPTWVPKPGLRALREEEEALQERRKAQMKEQEDQHSLNGEMHEVESGVLVYRDEAAPTETIERPRSALHRGDFSELSLTTAANFCQQHGHDLDFSPNSLASFGSSPPPWLSASPPNDYRSTISKSQEGRQIDTLDTRRQRAPSLGSSLSSSFIMRTPTSPLVYATSNPYLDRSQVEHPNILPNEQSNRRRTMPPHAFQSISMSPLATTPPNFSRPLPPLSLRRESSLPYQIHQSRRSLSSVTYQPKLNAQTPPARNRRLSAASDAYSGRRSSMVGSFEESILRGRMSTPPSKPLDFVAQIGVMGKGDCPSNLQCPAHVSVPFPAVFYNYPSSYGPRSLADDVPSPYVGTIDLERSLKPVILDAKKRKPRRDNSCTEESVVNLDHNSPETDLFMNSGKQKQKATSQTSLSIGGAYRVPKQGQLQIIIKNPNKTAVKLFLVPYDLDGMEAGTKTFVRQRSFSSGPIIENALLDKTNRQATLDPLENKLILRYLIHLKFCCPSKGRYYLHDNVRVVFANRVPDGKEKLRNEVQLPDPKFSTYKPSASSLRSRSSISSSTTPTNLTPSFGSPSRFFGDIDGLEGSAPANVDSMPSSETLRSKVIPFHFPSSTLWKTPCPPKRAPDINPSDLQQFQFPDARSPAYEGPQLERTLSPVAGFKASSSSRVSPVPWSPSNGDSITRSFSPAPVEAGDGLLSRQFRELNDQVNRQDFKNRAWGVDVPFQPSPDIRATEEMPTEGDIGLARVDLTIRSGIGNS